MAHDENNLVYRYTCHRTQQDLRSEDNRRALDHITNRVPIGLSNTGASTMRPIRLNVWEMVLYLYFNLYIRSY